MNHTAVSQWWITARITLDHHITPQFYSYTSRMGVSSRMSHRCFSGLALFVTIKSWQPCAEAKKVFTYICIIGKSKKVSLLRGSNNGGCWGDLPVTFSFLIVIILCDFWPGNSFLGPNKLAKPQRCVSQVHFVKLHFGNWGLSSIRKSKVTQS